MLWHGTASVEFVCAEGRILFDPFVPLKGSDVPVKIEDFDGFAGIFVTHGHFDHISSLPPIVKRNPKSLIYCTKTPYRTLQNKGLSERNLKMIRFNEVLEVNGFRIRTFHSKHAILPKASLDRVLYILKHPARSNIPNILKEHHACVENDETLLYQIEADGKRVVLMGSLNLRDDVEYPVGADLLVLPYNGWEDNYPPAVRVINKLQPKRVVLDHYDDTFPPFTSPLDLRPILSQYGERIKAMELGRTVVLGE